METLYVLGGIALGSVGLAGLAETAFDVRRWRAAPTWPVAEGMVVSSRVRGHHAHQDDYTEHLRFLYTFKVNGRKFTGRRIRAGQEPDLTLGSGPGSAWSSARSDAARYPIGSAVYVRYDPNNPKNCCLETGGLTGIALKLAFCIGLVLGGAVMIKKSLRV